MPPCPICLEDKAAFLSVTLLCGHAACRPCLGRWFAVEERTGQVLPTCAVETCRCPVPAYLARGILGRPFVPAGSRQRSSSSNSNKRKRPIASVGESQEEESNSNPKAPASAILTTTTKTRAESNKNDKDNVAATQMWLDANTIECGGCEGRIMKDSGCDKLQCICGYRVCWKCRTAKAACSCNPGHGFIDNITGLPTYRHDGANVATKEELKDLKSFLEKKRSEQTPPRWQQRQRRREWFTDPLFVDLPLQVLPPPLPGMTAPNYTNMQWQAGTTVQPQLLVDSFVNESLSQLFSPRSMDFPGNPAFFASFAATPLHTPTPRATMTVSPPSQAAAVTPSSAAEGNDTGQFQSRSIRDNRGNL